MSPAGGRQARSGRSAGASSPLQAYLRETASPLGAAALTLPLLAVHGLGTIFAPEVRNGADLVTVGLDAAFRAADLRGATPWAAFYGVVALIQAGLVAWLASRGRLAAQWLVPFFLECASYAVICGVLSGLATHHLLDALTTPTVRIAVPLAAAAAPIGGLDAVLISFGAGFHEELVFRLGAMAGLGRRFGGEGWRRQPGLLLALWLGSAVVFSAAHHLVEPWSLGAFVFRTAMGLLFGGLFLVRGFATAAWSHALYDIWVLVVAG